MGVEPTPESAKDTGYGFEDHEDHRAPCASASKYRGGVRGAQGRVNLAEFIKIGCEDRERRVEGKFHGRRRKGRGRGKLEKRSSERLLAV